MRSTVTSRDGAAGAANEERIRARVHELWQGAAGSWEQHAAYADARGATVTARMLELVAPAPGERVLELACGPGGVGLAAAELVGPAGEVVLSDVAVAMTSIAADRARARGLRNVRTRVLDLEQIDEPDGSYDIVLCREGLMFAVDPARAAREIARVLRPGGRASIAVWGPRARNPWLGLVFDAAAEQLERPVPPPGVPSPFALDDAERLERALQAGGLVDVQVGELPTPLRAGSFDEWWTRTRALAGPLTAMLAGLAAPAQLALEARLRAAVAPYETSAGLDLPGVTLIASARRAAR